MDPQLTIDGKPYAPKRLAEIVEERYQISKHINTSYDDVGKMTPIEREYILKFIANDINQENELIRQAQEKIKKR